ncbi:50S ribosomal protein L25/general stress protein Ctc [Rothia kristinae]|uniref:Large ribosomal subunit protein bL25 n=1 Tax=Rothia kristinae TaxID=37923 RepID=A0A7T4MUU3_9MICC|nr:50S ribosomal protein L25/general stress protein Ctc [Rothia kristinae]MDN5639777.1 50S ribosomal protein L25/general stress protein Ctc [Actinomycetes bacterium]QQC60010.1 50S ribosomal protein L25/general stress protein Ctc [Rothia kristinae]
MADRIKISAEARDDFGKGYARRLRKAGKIPAVIYGHGAEPVHIALPGHETMLAARNPNAVLSVDVDGTNHLTLIKDVQRHAIRPEIYHVDLLTVRRGERVEVEVPVVVEGEVAPGNISTQSESVLLLDVDALDVPEELLVDVTDRQDGEHVTAADVLLPEDVTLVSDPELIVVNVSAEVEQDLGEEPETEGEGEDSEASEGSEEE